MQFVINSIARINYSVSHRAASLLHPSSAVDNKPVAAGRGALDVAKQLRGRRIHLNLDSLGSPGTPGWQVGNHYEDRIERNIGSYAA